MSPDDTMSVKRGTGIHSNCIHLLEMLEQVGVDESTGTLMERAVHSHDVALMVQCQQQRRQRNENRPTWDTKS